MTEGNLLVNVYSGSIANPVSNARVTILKNGSVINTVTTNMEGQTELIYLDTVNESYQEENQKEVRPYNTFTVMTEVLGLTTSIIEGVQIFDGVTSIQNIYLTSIDDNQEEDTSVITPNTLWGDYPPSLSTPEEENEAISPIVLTSVVIPPYIIVHDGTPSNTNAQNYTVPFTDYIKNVASSEIYPSWPEETIKANVLAILSFTLNRIYTEWYPSKGYDFTITSTTSYDQKYTRNGTIFEPISKIVDEIFSNYIRSGIRVEPLLAHYKSETSEKGYLSQWGSKNLGDQGYSALEILRYYYGNTINIYEAEINDSYPYSFTTSLKEGDCSIDVYTLQNTLNFIRGSYPAIPEIENPTGYFDSNTTKAVKKFQEIFSLSQMGIVNKQTWYKISYLLAAVYDMTSSIYS